MTPSTITINTATLKSASTLLHDARFCADELIFERENQRFRMNCWVLGSQDPSDGSKRRRWDKWLFRLFNVRSCKIDVKERVDYYELAEISFDEQRQSVELITQYAISIRLTVGDLSGSLVATGESKDF
jgi:hypothetical protein